MKKGGSAERAIRTIVLVCLTVVGVEWIHYRLGEPTLWDLGNDRTASGPAFRIEDGGITVTEADFELYIRVLETMQADHELTVAEAAEAADLSLPRFRGIEARVQRDPLLVQRTRELLRKKAEDLYESRIAG